MFSVYLLFIMDSKFYAVALGSRTDTAPLCTGVVVFRTRFALLIRCFCCHLCSAIHSRKSCACSKSTYVSLHVSLARQNFSPFTFIVFTSSFSPHTLTHIHTQAHLFCSSTFYGFCAFCLLFSRTVLHHHEFAYHSFFLRYFTTEANTKSKRFIFFKSFTHHPEQFIQHFINVRVCMHILKMVSLGGVCVAVSTHAVYCH